MAYNNNNKGSSTPTLDRVVREAQQAGYKSNNTNTNKNSGGSGVFGLVVLGLLIYGLYKVFFGG